VLEARVFSSTVEIYQVGVARISLKWLYLGKMIELGGSYIQVGSPRRIIASLSSSQSGKASRWHTKLQTPGLIRRTN